MIRRIFTRDHFRSFGDGMVKLVMDCLLTFIFSYFVLTLVCSFIPHIAEHYSSALLLDYALFFTLVWNILLSSSAISILTIGVFFASMVAGLVFYLINDSFNSFIDSYFRWISTLFLPVNAGNDLYEYITVVLIASFLVLLMTLFSSRHSNAGLVFVLILPFTIYYDFSTDTNGNFLFSALLFGFSLFYMRFRQSIYLDYRLTERDEIRYTKLPNLTMLPSLFLALLISIVATQLPSGLFVGSDDPLHLGNRLKDFLVQTENNFFESRKDIEYDIDRIGEDDHEGRFLNSSHVKTLSVESYSPDVNHLYLRSYSYRDFDNQWLSSPLSGVDPHDPQGYFDASEKEMFYARRLLLNRAVNSYDQRDKSQEYFLYKLIRKASVAVHYQDISTRTLFEVPLATNYSLFSSSSLAIRDDVNGSGLFSESGSLPGNTGYTADCYMLDKNEYTISLYRYFGEGYYRSLTPREAEYVYGDAYAVCRDNALRIQREYTSLSGIDPDILSLSQSLTAGLSTQADKALAIVAYLSENYRYDPDIYLPEDGSNFVETFLFETKSGSAVHFASAATLMMRASGIPSRYAEGYLATAGGSLGPVDVRQRDEHAWAEIYLEGLGWLPIEATPGRGMLATELLSPDYGHTVPEVFHWKDLTPEKLGKSLLQALLALLEVLQYLLISAVVLLLFLILFCFLRRGVLFLTLKGYRGYRLTLLYLFWVLSLSGHHREKGEGLLTYALRLDASLPEKLRLAPFVRAAYAASYGGEPIPRSTQESLRVLLFQIIPILHHLGISLRGILTGLIL